MVPSFVTRVNSFSLGDLNVRLPSQKMFTIVQTPRGVLPHPVRMKIKELTPKQLSSVPCPTCGVAVGKRCVLHSGARRSEPHVDRKLSAAAAIETKRMPRGTGHR
jgi:hypothetical protein